MLEKIKGYKTAVVGALIAVLGCLEALEWTNLVPDGYAGATIAIIGFVMLGLRAMTTTAIYKSK